MIVSCSFPFSVFFILVLQASSVIRWSFHLDYPLLFPCLMHNVCCVTVYISKHMPRNRLPFPDFPSAAFHPLPFCFPLSPKSSHSSRSTDRQTDRQRNTLACIQSSNRDRLQGQDQRTCSPPRSREAMTFHSETGTLVSTSTTLPPRHMVPFSSSSAGRWARPALLHSVSRAGREAEIWEVGVFALWVIS